MEPGTGPAYRQDAEPSRLPTKEHPMSDKSPRGGTTKKVGKSLKEKRAAKQAKSSGQSAGTEIITGAKKR